MALSFPKKAYKTFIHSFPILLLFFIAFTGFDLSFLLFNISFSFNFIYILIFFWILKKPERLGYGLVFFAGIINDVVQNFPRLMESGEVHIALYDFGEQQAYIAVGTTNSTGSFVRKAYESPFIQFDMIPITSP